MAKPTSINVYCLREKPFSGMTMCFSLIFFSIRCVEGEEVLTVATGWQQTDWSQSWVSHALQEQSLSADSLRRVTRRQNGSIQHHPIIAGMQFNCFVCMSSQGKDFSHRCHINMRYLINYLKHLFSRGII